MSTHVRASTANPPRKPGVRACKAMTGVSMPLQSFGLATGGHQQGFSFYGWQNAHPASSWALPYKMSGGRGLVFMAKLHVIRSPELSVDSDEAHFRRAKKGGWKLAPFFVSRFTSSFKPTPNIGTLILQPVDFTKKQERGGERGIWLQPGVRSDPQGSLEGSHFEEEAAACGGKRLLLSQTAATGTCSGQTSL